MMSWGCGAHLGDVLWGLAYTMRCAGNHTYHVLPQYVNELSPLAAGSRVQIASTDCLPPNAEDVWIANGRHENAGIQWLCQEDIIGFIQRYFNAFGNAWPTREEMLFDFQWLKPVKQKDVVLILNTQPQSGQCPGYSQEEMNRLALDLVLDGQNVIRVCGDEGQHNFSLTQIACLSAQAKLIIGGASGPFFATMNTAAKNAHRIVLLDPMRIDYGPNVGPIHTVKNCSEARQILKESNYFLYQIDES